MGRTFQNENISRQDNQDFKGQGDSAVHQEQSDIQQYRNNVNTLGRGGQIAPDPYKSADYLSNTNRLNADTLSGENDAAKQNLEDLNQRTGGRNTGATVAGIKQLALGKMRLGNTLEAQQAQQDFGKNLDYQRYLAGMPLQAASQEGDIYKTAAGGEADTGHDLTQYGIEQMRERQKQMEMAIKAASAAATMGLGGGIGGLAGIAGSAAKG